MMSIDALGSLERRVYDYLKAHGAMSAYSVALGLNGRPVQSVGNVYRVLQRMEPYGYVESYHDGRKRIWRACDA